ncbi:MAG: hypothetical protein ABEJ80_09315 [Halarchaeum sp.]
MDARTALAVVLGTLLGLLCVARPDVALRLSVVGVPIPDRHGPDGEGGVSTRMRWLVRVVGAACLLVSGYLLAA